jgi:hypothetical protein
MPIPSPNKEEGREEYIERCMSDETMVDEYDTDQRFAVCKAKYDEQYDEFDENQLDLIDLINEMMSDLISEVKSAKNAFSQEEIDETFTEYKKSVNMSYSELKRWSENKCSRKASLGRDAINRNLKLLSKKKADWTSNDATEARKAIAYIARAIKQPQGKDVSKECPYSKNYIALKNWAYDRNK